MPVNMNMKILVVDDSKPMVKIIVSLLKQLGFNNADEASDGHTGLAKLRSDKFDLVISDWNMEPGMNGLDFLKAVRADAGLKSLPFILITAESKTENVVAAKQAGVNNYIVKPFNAETLKGKMVAVIGEF
jgi:two-component system chemotaxis response regulator CheY